MADVVDRATRSRMMAGIRGRDTGIELAIRKALHARGFRFRVNDRRLRGRPDIVLPRWDAVILVHGCFWHSHDCGLCRLPSTRPEFWRDKLAGNAERDERNRQALLKSGWRVATVWECALRGRGPATVQTVADQLGEWLRGRSPLLDLRG
jgi:DNA mismatch endonuclease (patch repair protein)